MQKLLCTIQCFCYNFQQWDLHWNLNWAQRWNQYEAKTWKIFKQNFHTRSGWVVPVFLSSYMTLTEPLCHSTKQLNSKSLAFVMDWPAFPPQGQSWGRGGCWGLWCSWAHGWYSHCCCPAAIHPPTSLTESEREREKRQSIWASRGDTKFHILWKSEQKRGWE